MQPPTPSQYLSLRAALKSWDLCLLIQLRKITQQNLATIELFLRTILLILRKFIPGTELLLNIS